MKMHRVICRALTTAILIGTWTLGADAARAAITLAKDGKAQAVVVHNGHATVASGLNEQYVQAGHIKPPAEELAHYLQQMTGADFPVVATLDEAGEQPVILFEIVERVPGASDRETAGQAYRIGVKNNRLTLTAASPLGLHYAVYGLLEDYLGCRFYNYVSHGLHYQGAGYEIVPQRPTLTLPNIDALHEPQFPNRGIIYWVGSDPWVLKNRGGGARASGPGMALNATHNLYHLLPPRDRGAVTGLFADHPEFYPMTEAGERRFHWAMGICGTNEELPEFLAAGLKREISDRIQRAKAKGKPVDWSIPFPAAQGDGFAGCHCPKCRALVHKQQSEAAPLILALNRTLDIVNQEYPEAQLITFAYFQTLDVPETLAPHPNLWINVVSSARSQNMAGDQMGPIADNPANRDYAKAIREWPTATKGKVAVWHWDSYRAEWPSMFHVAENVRFMRDAGVYAATPQHCGGPWWDLLAWLYLKMTWNPDADADGLIRQFCEDNYGVEAGGHVYDYLRMGHEAYENSLHVPSAVRWSGWTPILRLKLFPPSTLKKMTDKMNMALAAAEAAGDPERLTNLQAARGRSLDVMVLDQIAHSEAAWGKVKYAGDGKTWFVAGGDPRVPPALMRAKKGIVRQGGGEHGVLRGIASYVADNGGPLVELTSAAVNAGVCPDLKGQIVSVRDKKTGRELLAGKNDKQGYMDVFQRIHAQIWLPEGIDNLAHRMNEDWSRLWSDFTNPSETSLDTRLVLSPGLYGFKANRNLKRTVRVADRGIVVERSYTGRLNNPNRFTTRWRLALPEPNATKIMIRGGGIDQMLDLQHAVPGGIKGVRAGEERPGVDWMEERFDMVMAVSDAKVTRLDVNNESGDDVLLTVDRGDGIAVVLATPAAGWEAVEVKPVVEQNYVEVTLVGADLSKMEEEAENLTLPLQSLSVRDVPVSENVSTSSPAPAEPAIVPQIRMTGEDTAVNKRDGAELVWIPAGEFQRGSESGGGDERPKRDIHLDGYWMYRHPVTLGRYLAFCEATGREFAPTWGQDMHADTSGDDADYAVQLNWYEAAAYAQWAGGALPSEAQWEKAARGTDGREYPWGKEWDATKCVSMEETLYKFNQGFRPVGSYPAGASPYGVMDMAGNVWEWVADWYAYEYYGNSPQKNPTGPDSGSHKVIRGGCSLYDERFSRTTARMIMPPQVRDWTTVGFRCVITGIAPTEKDEH